MELHQIRYFLAACEEQSFTRAAEKCGIKQPSLSNAIRRLESEFGGPLFVRSSPVQLSSLGFELLPVLALIDEMAARARDIAADVTQRSYRAAASARLTEERRP
jgi:LysR family hydrogen peroxide-inducible transcriptional activator